MCVRVSCVCVRVSCVLVPLGASAPLMRARLVSVPCVVAAAYAAVVDSARYTGMRWLICTCRWVLGGDRGLLWASPDYNFPSGRSLLGYRPVSHLPTNIDAVDTASPLRAPEVPRAFYPSVASPKDGANVITGRAY